jgi:anti-sigma B factor antagonist
MKQNGNYKMNFSQRNKDNVLIIDLEGRFDKSYDTLENELSQHVKGSKKVIINCNGLTYINSFALRSILKVLKIISADDGIMVFSNLTKQIKDIFFITGFFQMFQVYDTEEEAMIFLNEEQNES